MKEVIFIHVLYLLLIRTFIVKGNTKCESKVELRAVLLSCPVRESGCDDDDPISQVMNSEEAQILQASGKDFETFKKEKEKGFPKNVKDCKRKLVITLKIKNIGKLNVESRLILSWFQEVKYNIFNANHIGRLEIDDVSQCRVLSKRSISTGRNSQKIPCDDEYIIIDHVFDPVSGGKGRLLSPVVLKIRQEQMIELYGLRFKKVVNSDPFEEQKSIEKTCSVNLKNPTCGVTTYNGKPIPFSEGFCCSSDQSENAESQLSATLPKDSLQSDSDKSSRFARADISYNTIFNPHLVQLVTGEDSNPNGENKSNTSKNKKGSKERIKTLNLDNLPNFLFERDRKIICKKKDFLKELSQMQKQLKSGMKFRENDQISYSKNPTNEKTLFDIDSNNDDSKGRNVQNQSPSESYEENVERIIPSVKISRNNVKLGGGKISNRIVLKNLLLALSAEHTTQVNSLYEKLPDSNDETKLNEVIREKRESREESFGEEKELSLEEKLENFSRQKNHFKNRRKRLFGLSHKKFQKGEIHCRNAEECHHVVVTDYPPSECGKTLPPRYFFIHDKTIVKPSCGGSTPANSTCKPTCDIDFGKCSSSQSSQPSPAPVQPHQETNAKKNHCQKPKPTHKKGCPNRHKTKTCQCKAKKVHKSRCNAKPHEPKSHGCKTQHKCPTVQKEETGGNTGQSKNTEGTTKNDHEKAEKEKELENLQQKAEFYQKKLLASILEDKQHEKEKLKNFFVNRNYERQRYNPESYGVLKKPEDGNNELGDISTFNVNRPAESLEVFNKIKKVDEGKENGNEKDGNPQNTAIEIYAIKGDGSGPWLKIPESPVKILEPASKTSEYQIKIPEPYNQELGNINNNVPFDNTINYEKNSQKWKDDSIDKKKILLDRKFTKNLQKEKNRRLHPSSNGRDTDFNVEVSQKNLPSILASKFDPSRTDFIQKVQANTKTKVYNLANEVNNKPTYSISQNAFLPVPAAADTFYKAPQKYYLLKNGKYKTLEDLSFHTDDDLRQYLTVQQEKKQIAPARTNTRQRQNYESYVYKKPSQHHYITQSELSLKKTRQSYLNNLKSSGNQFYTSRFQRKGYPDLFFKDPNEFISDSKTNFDEKDYNDSPDFSTKKIRIRRNVEETFELAQGFFTSELKGLSGKGKDTNIIHALNTCPPQRKVRTSDEEWEALKDQPNSLAFNSEVISTFEESRNDNNLPFIEIKKADGDQSNSEKRITNDRKRLIQSYLNAPDYVLEEMRAQSEERLQNAELKKRDVAKSPQKNYQRIDKDFRGGNKDCDEANKGCQSTDNGSQGTDKADTFKINQSTAHCMRFGDMWYSLYAIKRPIIAQTIGIQLFDKQTLCDGTTEWRDLTKGKMVRVGTFLPKAEDDLPSISVSFTGGKTKKSEHAIDSDNYMVLIPSHVSDPNKAGGYPQLDGGPEEYLLVRTKDISDGKDCNMIGTSFEAFALQQDRCLQKKGSCLKRQPVDLWREDMEARIRGKRGKYFVENFGTIPESPVKTYTNFSGDFLALEYHGEYTSTLEIEVKADSNAIVRKGSVAQIPSVYIDSTYPRKTRIILSVLNIGLSSSYFRPRLGDCPPDLDPAWCPLEGPLVTIPPHQRHDFKLDLSGILPPTKISLSVQVLNQMNKKIAYRKIIIKKAERCICAFHCKCNCFGGYRSGRACHKLSVDDYRAAGYIGPFPYRGGVTYASPDLLKNIYIVLLTATYFLLFLGVLKAVLGIFCRRLGIAGVRIITGPRQLPHYYETELQFCSVLYNDCGFPVHPTTCLPVQIVPLCGEVIINTLFFFLYPIRGTYFLCLSITRNKYICTGCDNCCSPNDTFFYEHSSSSPLLSKSQQQTCLNYNLTTFNTKKGKAEEFLPYLPYDGDDDPLEEDDTEFVLQEMKRYRKK